MMSRQTQEILESRLESLDREIKKLENEYIHIANQLLKHEAELSEETKTSIKLRIVPKDKVIAEKKVEKEQTKIKLKKVQLKQINSIEKEQAEANRLGMSYGKYQALKYLKEKGELK